MRPHVQRRDVRFNHLWALSKWGHFRIAVAFCSEGRGAVAQHCISMKPYAQIRDVAFNYSSALSKWGHFRIAVAFCSSVRGAVAEHFRSMRLHV